MQVGGTPEAGSRQKKKKEDASRKQTWRTIICNGSWPTQNHVGKSRADLNGPSGRGSERWAQQRLCTGVTGVQCAKTKEGMSAREGSAYQVKTKGEWTRVRKKGDGAGEGYTRGEWVKRSQYGSETVHDLRGEMNKIRVLCWCLVLTCYSCPNRGSASLHGPTSK